MKKNLNDTRNGIPKFYLFHNNVRSLKRNFKSLETYLLNELEYHFRITKTKLANSELLEQLPSLPGYEFEFVPSPLSAGGVGMFISGEFKYSGTSEHAKCLNHLARSFFSTVGQKLAANVPDSNCHYCEYLLVTNTNFTSSFFFEPVISSERTRNLASTIKKAYGLYSCPICVLKCAKKGTFITLS